MEQHAKICNSYGIPQIFGSFRKSSWSEENNKNHRELQSLCKQLQELNYDIEFLRIWVLPTQAPAMYLGIPMTSEQKPLLSSVEETIQELLEQIVCAKQLIQQLVKVQKALADYMMYLNSPSLAMSHQLSNPSPRPQMLLRGFCEGSHCTFSEDLGIRASKNRMCKPASTIDELVKMGELSQNSLAAHCERKMEPTPWISLMHNPAWILKNFQMLRGLGDTDKGHVAFINVKKLECMGVFFQRSNNLAYQANIARWPWEKDGVKYTSPTHWLAYAWIPRQCIDQVWTYPEFAKRCANRGIRKGDAHWE